MTQMLASVVNMQEAMSALQAGVDIIDLKNPAEGALGALPLGQISAIVDGIAGHRAVSATVGDLPPDPRLLVNAIDQTAATGVNYIKVGFFSPDRLDDCLQAIAPLTRTMAIIAVLFADRAPPHNALTKFVEAGFTGVMIDTANKESGRLIHHSPLVELGDFITQSRQLGLLSGLAGSLSYQDIPPLLTLNPDYLGFRGALCHKSERTHRLDPGQLAKIRGAIPKPTAHSGARSLVQNGCIYPTKECMHDNK